LEETLQSSDLPFLPSLFSTVGFSLLQSLLWTVELIFTQDLLFPKADTGLLAFLVKGTGGKQMAVIRKLAVIRSLAAIKDLRAIKDLGATVDLTAIMDLTVIIGSDGLQGSISEQSLAAIRNLSAIKDLVTVRTWKYSGCDRLQRSTGNQGSFGI
jgi:hypothetical protein